MEGENIKTALEALEKEMEEAIGAIPEETWDRLVKIGGAISNLKSYAGIDDTGYEFKPGIVLTGLKTKLETKAPTKIYPDTFFQHTPGEAAKKYLKMMGSRARHIDEIYENLMGGGFKIDGKDDKEERRALYLALARNNAEFVLVQKSTFGLVEFYPKVRGTMRRTRPPKGKDTISQESEEGALEESQGTSESDE